MKTKLLFFGAFIFVLLAGVSMAQAANPFAITFPIPELGNCADFNSCKTYCDDAANLQACTDFGEKQGLISKQDVEQNQKLAQQFSDAPGGCKSEQECKTYCNDPSHLDECLKFAEDHGFVSQDDAARIKKSGFSGGPGNCKSKDECKAYCDDATHQEECISFGEKNGFMTKEEADQARKFANRAGPGGCKGEECKTYCDDQSHRQECFQFAKDNGLISGEEADRAEKFMKISEQGGPGGCKGEECRTYCDEVSHHEECFKFAKDNGLVSKEDEQQFEVGQKLGDTIKQSGGPGGCKNEDECRAYCGDPGHVEECVAFGSAHAGISQDQARRMLQQFTEQKFQSQGQFAPPKELEDLQQQSEQKFQQFRQLEQQFRGPQMQPMEQQGQGQIQPQQFRGPGGCTSPETCIKYCSDNPEKCFNFGPGSSQGPGQPQQTPPEGGVPPGQFQQFQLKQNLMQMQPPQQFPGNTQQPFEKSEGMPFQQQPGQQGEFENSENQPNEQNQMMPQNQMMQPENQQQFMPPPPMPNVQQGPAPQPSGGSILDAVLKLLKL